MRSVPLCGTPHTLPFRLKEDNVKVVVVETAADILRDEEEAQHRDEDQKKYLG